MPKKNEVAEAVDVSAKVQEENQEPSNAGENSSVPEQTEAPKKRGRPKGSKNSGTTGPTKTRSRQSQDTETLGKQLVGLHRLAAIGTGLPELEISDQEGQILASGINAVCLEYGLSMSGKTGAAMQLIGALGMIYVPRAMAVKYRMDKQREEKERNAPIDIPVNSVQDFAQ